MSGRDPYPSPKVENDFTLSGFRPPQRKTYDEPSHITQTEDPWNHLHNTPTQASTRRSVEYCEHQAPNKSLDLALNSIYDHHKDAFCSKSQILCQKETVSEDHRKRENLEKQNMLEKEQQNDIKVWVDPKKVSIHSIK
ncbi:cilia- and flagella-associated protein 276 isoform 1-T1 [Odontesthes bonariensis]|uniref:cilia- and flagella-associated protein 276 n=1 Tax=Odontesthes bonariensis TaxID=219752 RepID=UPI003F58946C